MTNTTTNLQHETTFTTNGRAVNVYTTPREAYRAWRLRARNAIFAASNPQGWDARVELSDWLRDSNDAGLQMEATALGIDIGRSPRA